MGLMEVGAAQASTRSSDDGGTTGRCWWLSDLPGCGRGRPRTDYGRLNAKYSDPDGGPMRPPPAAIATYCLPSTL